MNPNIPTTGAVTFGKLPEIFIGMGGKRSACRLAALDALSTPFSDDIKAIYNSNYTDGVGNKRAPKIFQGTTIRRR